MSEKNTGGPAFPTLERSYEDRCSENTIHVTEGGMTLRDWFAGKALEGLLAGRGAAHTHESRAVDAYAYADAMLKAREN
jgi:hypothetical protein